MWQSRLFGPEGPAKHVKSIAAWLYMHLLPRVSIERRLFVWPPLGDPLANPYDTSSLADRCLAMTMGARSERREEVTRGI
mmetsp:Transcript_7080/g.11522  ORF Transcript_7080/g.11522 Transcript_7080/m.11522 type:complete len:80 (+) Transcript_7080:185-424(+)